MARVEHRRIVTAAEARSRRPTGAARRLGPVGWAFAGIAVAWLGVELRPLLDWGAFETPSWSGTAMLVVRAVGNAAILALPAGLLLGYPAARRRNRWLFRGMVLLALVQLADPALNAAAGWVRDQSADPFGDGLGPLEAALSMLSLATGVMSLTGALAISDGLFDAGARPRRLVIAVIATAGVGLQLAFIVPLIMVNGLEVFRAGVIDVLRLAVSLALFGAWYVIGLRLAVGFPAGLRPRRAWAVGGVAGALFVGERLATVLLSWAVGAGQVPEIAGPVTAVIASAVWVLLLVALALGLGRGSDRGAGDRRRIRRHELGPRAG